MIYLQPLPQEADRLSFTLEELSAVREDGVAVSLPLSISEIGGKANQSQRLLASGNMPPGRYVGLSLTVGSAVLKGEEEDSDLLVPNRRVRLDYPLDLRQKKASLLLMALNYAHSVTGRYQFSPSFSVMVPERPPIGVLGYAANARSNTITVFDKKTREVVGLIATERGPKGMALDRRARRGYVTLSEDDAIEVIDVTSGEIINRIRLHAGDAPQEPALTPDGNLLLTANTGSDTVSLLDPYSLIELARISVGDGPHSVLMDPLGRRAYVFNTFSDTVSVIDIANRSIAATVAVGPEPLRGEMNKSGDRLYIIYKGSPYLTVMDPQTLSPLQRVFVGMGMTAIKTDTRTGLLYIANSHEATVNIYDPFSLFPVDSIPIGSDAVFLAIDGDENNLVLALPDRKAVMIVSLVSRKVVSQMDVGEEVYWITLMGER